MFYTCATTERRSFQPKFHSLLSFPKPSFCFSSLRAGPGSRRYGERPDLVKRGCITGHRWSMETCEPRIRLRLWKTPVGVGVAVPRKSVRERTVLSRPPSLCPVIFRYTHTHTHTLSLSLSLSLSRNFLALSFSLPSSLDEGNLLLRPGITRVLERVSFLPLLLFSYVCPRDKYWRCVPRETAERREVSGKLGLRLTSCAGMTRHARRGFFLSQNCNIFSDLSIFKCSPGNNKFITSQQFLSSDIIIPTNSKRKRRIIVYGLVTRYGPQSVAQRNWLQTLPIFLFVLIDSSVEFSTQIMRQHETRCNSKIRLYNFTELLFEQDKTFHINM